MFLSPMPTPNQCKTCIKHTFLTKKIMQKKKLPTYLPYFFFWTVTGNKQFLFLGLRALVLPLPLFLSSAIDQQLFKGSQVCRHIWPGFSGCSEVRKTLEFNIIQLINLSPAWDLLDANTQLYPSFMQGLSQELETGCLKL